jgi:hypothetical protein
VEDIDELLRIVVDHGKPGALHLDHGPVSFLEGIKDVLQQRFRQQRCIKSGQALGGPGSPPPQDGALKVNESFIVVLWAPASWPARCARLHVWYTQSDPSPASSV